MTPYEDAALIAGLPYIVNYMQALVELQNYGSTEDAPEGFKEIAVLLAQHRTALVEPYNSIEALLDDAADRLENLDYEGA